MNEFAIFITDEIAFQVRANQIDKRAPIFEANPGEHVYVILSFMIIL